MPGKAGRYDENRYCQPGSADHDHDRGIPHVSAHAVGLIKEWELTLSGEDRAVLAAFAEADRLPDLGA